ncbi:GNAT family N-acetyltransferase [Streptomyces sp. NPDC049577]|uniref:GNAT family N-acetyltransferase n=1 Tax=Streptomyces sp. NPDC049577 TaxID=3155153 RepID=UPI00343A8AB5
MTDGITCASHAERPIPPAAVLALYRQEGWWPERTGEQVAEVLGRFPAAGAWRGEELVGFARAVTDGALRGYVEDVVVRDGCRGNAVGHELMSCLLAQLGGVSVVSLFCSARLVPFYERSGFTATRQVVLHRAAAGGRP